jgi:phosphoenolpyruvate synthase/pyruvate phosphate dikinase
MKWVYPFTSGETPDLTQVGGKAMSLILMTQRGLRVPPGFVLTVAFFQPWLEQIQRSPEWTQALDSFPEELEERCDAVKALCRDLELDTTRQDALARALHPLQANGHLPLFAVRSSSPEEDLEALSFAGGYETNLGVAEDDLADAVRRSFASCFAARVLHYKREHGLTVDQPRIAVIVQQQIAAEQAGVAFSLNPINNCYDEVVINANFGLGESVVSGLVSPDSYVVDKVSRTLLERTVGSKETSIWLAPDGGTYREPAPNRGEFCLADEEALTLADLVDRVEDHFGRPMDVEWAFSDGLLYLLQARPVTAYFPLPERMLTPPGAQKLLYGDVTLLKWGMHEPLSVLGTDFLDMANVATLRMTMGQDISPEVTNLTRFAVEGRTYATVSHTIKLQGKERVTALFREMDGLSAEIIATIDEDEYVPDELPPPLKGLTFKLIWNNLGVFWQGIRALMKPVEYRRRFLEELDALEQALAKLASESMPLREFAERTMDTMSTHLDAFFAIVIAAQIAKSRIKKAFQDEPPEIRDQFRYLERALPHNTTIDMGLTMVRLAQSEEVRTCESGAAFAAKLQAGQVSEQFREAWDTFMARYGFRSPMEMDPAAPRFYEQPARFFEQLRTLAGDVSPEHNPQAIYEQAKAQRDRAYHSLLQIAREKGKRRAKRVEKNYQVWLTLGGYRETPKYYVSLIADLFRRRAFATAQWLMAAGRLDDANQVFDLRIDDLDRALVDPALDLRVRAEENTAYLRKFQHVREFPRIVDSRGKILRGPKKETMEGELVGEPISPGVVRGPVKVLCRPDEKPVLPGDILVTRATDPGWTPLFINASGVVLEVGGTLQHGALVAREYGKPCVSGIEGATNVLKDGQMIELDGTNGVVRWVKT